MINLNPRERRLVAVLILVVAVMVVIYGIVVPLAGGFAARAEARSVLAETYVRDERALQQLPSARRVATAQHRDAARFTLAGATPAVAADALKAQLAGAVAASGGDLRAVEDTAAPPGAVAARIDARLTTAQLAALLAAIGRGEPLLVVEALTVAADQSLQSGRAAPMDVRLEVSGPYPAATPR